MTSRVETEGQSPGLPRALVFKRTIAHLAWKVVTDARRSEISVLELGFQTLGTNSGAARLVAISF